MGSHYPQPIGNNMANTVMIEPESKSQPFHHLSHNTASYAAITSLSLDRHSTVPLTAIQTTIGCQSAPLSVQSSGGQQIAINVTPLTPAQQQRQQYQRLNVEDAQSYLDLVKYKFSNQPQIYNDFLDIMKEFKSQSIDTPVVIHRVITLFAAHPDLIVGFNLFLPDGNKIEMRANDEMPIGSTDTFNSGAQPIDFDEALDYVDKLRNRFQAQPDIYEQFLEILHTYYTERRSLIEGTAVHNQKILTETEMLAKVAKLLVYEKDLLQKFRQFIGL